MSCYRNFFRRIVSALFFIALLSVSTGALAQDGQALFKANCASCHKPDKDFTGPALKGARDREPSKDWVYKWVANTTTMVESDPYAKALKAKYGAVMNAFPQLKKEEIDAILDWADKYTPGGDAPKGGASAQPASDSSLIFGILTLVLALVAFILLQVNSNLRKLSDEKDGIRRSEPVPFYKNKAYIMAAILVLFAVGGYYTINGAIGLGRQQGYQPVQPIYYSHKVHAGTNQISCLYCHGGAQDGKHANIPSVNVCMNCHKGISKYEGADKLVREDGVAVDGTAEIKKLYEYAGWNPDTKQYNPDNNGDGIPDGATSIEWVKIHSLPDHVYFNHSQHVKVGKQQCQTCHGNIQEMDEVYQFSTLSMGWCVNCHRETKVDFSKDGGNKYYNTIYQKFYNQMADSVLDRDGNKVANPHKLDSVTVEKIGGTECQRCHY
ncbi:MAG: c-type cytochrome [Ferruginibacter sp.]